MATLTPQTKECPIPVSRDREGQPPLRADVRVPQQDK